MIRLRPAEARDAVDLHHSCWPDRSLPGIQDFVTRCICDITERERGCVLVAEVEGQAVAFGLLTIWPDVGEISDLIVADQWRGHGIGTKLIETMIDAAQSTEVQFLEIGVMRRNTRARKLYERLGFKLHRSAHFYENGTLEPVDYLIQVIHS
jgi:ribosomal protein S18 acetylase RimI-like enzyme